MNNHFLVESPVLRHFPDANDSLKSHSISVFSSGTIPILYNTNLFADKNYDENL